MRLFQKEEVLFVLGVFSSIKRRIYFYFHVLQERVLYRIKPPTTSLVFGTLAVLTWGKAELLAENALLRHQLVILRRQIKRPVYRKADPLLLVLLASMVRTWKQALFLVQPETLMRWTRELFRLFWKRKSKAHSRKPMLSPETNRLIKEMAKNNRLWGAERTMDKAKTFFFCLVVQVSACIFMRTAFFAHSRFSWYWLQMHRRMF